MPTVNQSLTVGVLFSVILHGVILLLLPIKNDRSQYTNTSPSLRIKLHTQLPPKKPLSKINDSASNTDKNNKSSKDTHWPQENHPTEPIPSINKAEKNLKTQKVTAPLLSLSSELDNLLSKPASASTTNNFAEKPIDNSASDNTYTSPNGAIIMSPRVQEQLQTATVQHKVLPADDNSHQFTVNNYQGGGWDQSVRVGEDCFFVEERNPLDNMSATNWYQIDCAHAL